MSASVPSSGQAEDGLCKRNITTVYAPCPTAECLEHVYSLHPLTHMSQGSKAVRQQCLALLLSRSYSLAD